MAKIQTNDVVSPSYRGPDRRRSGPIRLQRWIITLVRSRWAAAFITALAVSYCFHLLEIRSDRKIERAQAIIECVVYGVDKAQQGNPPPPRVNIGPILQQCQHHGGKR